MKPHLSFPAWRSLKVRVTVAVLAIFLVGFWSLTFYASRILREDMQRLLGEQQFSTVTLLATQINEELASRLRAAESIVTRITPAMLDHPENLHALLEQRPYYLTLFNGGFVTFRADGAVTAVHPFVPERIGVNYMDRDFIAAALKEGKATISEPIIGRTRKAPIIAFAAPIRDPQGKVIGAMSSSLDLSKPNFLNTIMEHSYGKSGGYLLIAPRHRLIVTASDKRRIMEELPATGINSAIDRNVQGYEGTTVLVNPLGTQVLNSIKRIPVTGWYVVVSIPTAEVFAPVRTMQRRMLLAAILLTLLTGGLTWWLISRQLAPMFAAASTLATMAGSDQPMQPLPIARQDEVGELLGGFNKLLESLEKRNKALRESEERYRTLFESMDEGFCVIEMINDPYGKAIDYRFVEINPAFMKQTGLTDALTRTMRQMVPDHDEHWFEIYGKVARTGESIRFENPAVAMRRHYDVFAFRIGADGSQRVGILFNDITERKRAEQTTREQLAELQRWFDATLEREERMVELKREINELLARLGLPPRYSDAAEPGTGTAEPGKASAP